MVESPDDVAVRPAEMGDLFAVSRIEKRSFAQPWPYSAFERSLSAPAFLVAADVNQGVGIVTDTGVKTQSECEPERGNRSEGGDEGGSVVGFVVGDAVPNHGRPLAHVKDIAVTPERRNEGIGTTLLRAALTRLGDIGARTVKLEVREGNRVARSLYRQFGFEFLRRVPRYYDDGEAAIVLVRDLPIPDEKVSECCSDGGTPPDAHLWL